MPETLEEEAADLGVRVACLHPNLEVRAASLHLTWELGLYFSILSIRDLADKFLRYTCKYNFVYVFLIIKMCHVILIVH